MVDVMKACLSVSETHKKLTQCWVYVYHVLQLCERGVAAHEDRNLLYDVGGMCSVGMTRDDFALLVGEQLHHTLGFLHGQGLAVGTIDGFVGLIAVASSLADILTWDYAGSLGISEDG